MKLSDSIKPISQVKARMSEVVEDITKTHKKVIITHNGEACAVLQDIESYEEMQENLAMLKMLAISGKSIVEGKAKSLNESFKQIRRRVRDAD
ncbi:MAG: type II toxin-antitoxin system Phd/YefM family antitoxin [Chitinispirillaceae bacterium]|nr:type II toxin-antitoxin system Phd/YefM family antitoxin [Chitinispirillaceae bacterium]